MPSRFGGTAFEPMEEQARDKELTLGPAALIAMAFGLVALCALCFVWGYSTGHRAPIEAAASPAEPTGPSAAQLLAQAKPTANQASQQPHTDQTATPTDASAAAASEPSNAPSAVNAAYPAPASSPASSGDAAVVKTALPAQQSSSQASAASGQVQSALNQGSIWMVQIAAVSHSEDADVLVSALRKRGYVVSSRRDPADNLLHVQVGPFATHADASAMRQRLLNDGYNAIIEP
ncbi:SPOR domain-containing protein [Occallatibacter riparius]|uniref:SPOR domain-containing protein n=1 Tax=Occallatibacter riparius TaxID=1002689 RepID=A0A9J7BNZ2_9BACT|nr:SPOR domain-containing protein [Occallatibacter riparius]UWZ84241.1 SPOR domain-containing protein [Occallatibacter riparius]